MLSLINQILIKYQIKSIDKQLAHYKSFERNTTIPVKKLYYGMTIMSLSLRKKKLEDQLRIEKIKCNK